MRIMHLVMKTVWVLTVFVMYIAWADPHATTLDEAWTAYKIEFGKFYTSEGEDARRLNAYVETKRKVEEHNRKYERGETSFEMEINKYADWFPEELDRLNGLKISVEDQSEDGEVFELPPEVEVPDEMNWVKRGAVTRIKDQGKCGSCYTFSAVGALEGLMFVTNKTLTGLSTQELIDCSRRYGNDGCNGGWMNNCFRYVKGRRGISTDKSYRYEAKEGKCRAKNKKFGATCTGYVKLKKDENVLKKAVGTVGPVSIAFAVGRDFYHYKTGIYVGDCGSGPNHGMLVVGYGKDEETRKDYWLVKNSWGERWGLKGYVKIVRGVEKCLINHFSSYPVYRKRKS